MLKPQLRVVGIAEYSTPEPTADGPKMLGSGSMCGTFDFMSHRLRPSTPSASEPMKQFLNQRCGIW